MARTLAQVDAALEALEKAFRKLQKQTGLPGQGEDQQSPNRPGRNPEITVTHNRQGKAVARRRAAR